MNGWTAKDMPDQTGRVVLITGANSGVGYESAVAFARKGAQVVMACRSMDKAKEAQRALLQRVTGGKTDLMQLDLGSLKSVRAFTEKFKAAYDRLDILMNNAGIMIPPYGKTADGFETQMGTNHLGHFALTGLLLPKLLSTPNSRIVTVSSNAYTGGRINFDDLQSEKNFNDWGAYSQSKLANILFALELQRKLEATGANTISLVSHPGFAATNLQNQRSNLVRHYMIMMLRPLISQPAEPAAAYQLYAAAAPDVKGGEFYGPKQGMKGEVVRLEINKYGKDPVTATRLWKVSEQLTGVEYDVLEHPVLA